MLAVGRVDCHFAACELEKSLISETRIEILK